MTTCRVIERSGAGDDMPNACDIGLGSLTTQNLVHDKSC